MNRRLSTVGDIYYKICSDRIQYKGERYFRFNYNHDTVIQVCVNPGNELKRGRANTICVYVVNKMTLLSNYLSMNYVEICTKKEYEKQFNHVVKLLQ